MDYFESDVPGGNARCSDNACPCDDTVIPRGDGYLYIEPSLVVFRRRYPRLQDAKEAREQQLRKEHQAMGLGASYTSYRIGPILVCEQGAERRNLDLDVAAADAKHWWETGQVPLRATPIKGRSSPPPDEGLSEITFAAGPERKQSSPCFIATAACGTDRAADVVWLRHFRDHALRRSFLGRAFIASYELLSPPLARLLVQSPRACRIVRNLIVRPARIVAESWQNGAQQQHQLTEGRPLLDEIPKGMRKPK